MLVLCAIAKGASIFTEGEHIDLGWCDGVSFIALPIKHPRSPPPSDPIISPSPIIY